MVKRLLLAIALCFVANVAWAQNQTCPTRSAGDSTNACATTAFTQGAVKTPPGDVYFGSGRPWVDVRSGANGCAAATLGGGGDNQAAIQCQIDYMDTTYNGGVVYFPPANYGVASSIHAKHGVVLMGAGALVTNIIPIGDTTAVTFDSGVSSGGFIRLSAIGNTSSPTQDLVKVLSGANQIYFKDCVMKGGFNALNIAGVDSDIMNCSIEGFGASAGGVLSTGANTYYDAKIDESDTSVQYAFHQGTAGFVAENRIINSDTSGSYVNSIEIADANNQAITTITNTVVAHPAVITGAAWTMFAADEFGTSPLTAFGIVNIIGSSMIGGGALTVTGGTQNCAGNSSITCTPLPVAQGGTAAAAAGATAVNNISGAVAVSCPAGVTAGTVVVLNGIVTHC